MLRMIYSLSAQLSTGEEQSLSIYEGKVLLIVNTASRCGFTSQYEQLEKLYQRYHKDGFEILAFPCNQFGHQEPGTNTDIQTFCQLNYPITFPLFAKIDVNGADAHPLFKYLKQSAPGILHTEAIKWNFTKFLVDREGRVIKRYAPKDEPLHLVPDIEAIL